jgi:hypothetical protein
LFLHTRRDGGERGIMSKAYIIEIHHRTAGIVASDESGFTFFSSDRAVDRLEGRVFRSARDAERAARALLGVNHHRPAQEAVQGAFAV